MSKEAMKLALDAFSVIEISDNLDWIRHQAEQQAAALREALTSVPDWASEAKEQPAQPTVPQDIPDLIAGALGVSRGTAYDMMREALAEQPAPATELREQEPVAWIVEDQSGERLEWASDAHSCHGVPTFPLYTSPPTLSLAQRTWVGLSDEEISARAANFYNPEMYKRAALWAQEKLKERNQ